MNLWRNQTVNFDLIEILKERKPSRMIQTTLKSKSESIWMSKKTQKKNQINNVNYLRDILNMRVRSWLRINAGGAHKTCKSNESRFKLNDWMWGLVQVEMNLF